MNIIETIEFDAYKIRRLKQALVVDDLIIATVFCASAETLTLKNQALNNINRREVCCCIKLKCQLNEIVAHQKSLVAEAFAELLLVRVHILRNLFFPTNIIWGRF